MGLKETNYEKFVRYSTQTGMNVDGDNNLRVLFENGTYETLKFIGEFIATKNEVEHGPRTTVNTVFYEFPERFKVKVYKHPRGGEVITTVVYGENKKVMRNYFESMAEMGLLFSGTLRYVLFEKTLANTLHANAPGQYA